MINFKRQANAIKNCNKSNKKNNMDEKNKTNKNAVIAEIKVHSPKYGDLLKQRNELDILNIYEEAGAVGISYITDKQYFNGDFEVFKKICKNTELPVLRKDFITAKDEIEKTAEAGASTILLIPRLLSEETAEFVDYANSCGLDTLVEVHNAQEIEIAKNTKTSMIGINNRDIRKLELDDGTVSLTEKLANLIPKDRILVSESGISNLNDLNTALKYADAVLVGTSFMKADFKIQKEFVESFVRGKYD
ncbi:indole-3-glycerol phosphate synthase [Methanococcus voltae]|nr:indole-3-glycerol phosphate synthase TrpC [Methanococcus voltae]MBP2144456.1 indole-3-glycerol phosphate synthase [Methanococcus voltae]